jgi:hypothetical protein
MPINENVVISREISSLTFNSDDTVQITLAISENDVVKGSESYIAPSSAVTPVLDAPTDQGQTIRTSLVIAVYTYLVSNGLVPGQVVV